MRTPGAPRGARALQAAATEVTGVNWRHEVRAGMAGNPPRKGGFRSLLAVLSLAGVLAVAFYLSNHM